MNTHEPNSCSPDFRNEIDRLASAIAERGYDDIHEEFDDYAFLLPKYEFRKLVTFELYDAYFPSRRHEFELQLLTNLVDAVASSEAAMFVSGAIAGGIVGNAAYDVLKNGLAYIVRAFRAVGRTHDAVQEIAENVQKIRTYMERHDDVDIKQISSALDIEGYKIEPIMKLLGCRSRRIKKQRIWKKSKAW